MLRKEKEKKPHKDNSDFKTGILVVQQIEIAKSRKGTN